MEPQQIEMGTQLIYKIFMERQKIKMIWTKIHSLDEEETESAEDSKEDEQLTERQREENEAKKMAWGEQARQRTESLEALVDKLVATVDSKQKEFILRPINHSREGKWFSPMRNW